jgi:cardiolipin synthase
VVRFGKNLSVPSLRRLMVNGAAGFLAAQGAVIAALLTADALKKKGRSRRTGFPRPGTFRSDVGETATTTYTYGEDLFRDMHMAWNHQY